MIKLYDELKKQKLSAKMLLQVHDELILEVPDEQVEKTLKLVKETMENVVKISVPLTVDANFADSWDKAH
jgi:DNA polymerase-1